jgi:hypothetical protein
MAATGSRLDAMTGFHFGCVWVFASYTTDLVRQSPSEAAVLSASKMDFSSFL